ncbi:tail fiber domain-containing protein [Streptomyces sp. NPDC001822]|uniref:tail fiber domain-containing protein n=1 Tax=Streptomyces sp. NPDC001822 TaxID=3364614 RepID=UPI0036B0E2B1
MTITSYPFDAQSVTETQYSQMSREWQDSGVVASYEASGFLVSAGTGMTVNVQPGSAFLRGHFVNSTAVEPVTIPSAGSAVRVDRLILRLDPSLNSIVLAVKAGTAGSTTPPALTQTDTGIYELGLSQITVNASVTSITSGDIVSTRPIVGNRVGSWANSTRPTSPRKGQLGFNNSSATWEFWTGTAWAPLISSVDWANLSGKPSTFAPSAHEHNWADITDRPSSLPPGPHTHDWTQVTGKPTTFVPSAHGHAWSDLTGVPATFAPATHAHTWASITSKPTTFPPSSHSHSSYLESGDTISWSNGTKRVHQDSVSGSGTYYAVWVQGDGTFARNTSSRRFKQNIRDINIDPEAILSLRPRVYDRRPKEAGSDYLRDEFGLIAEEVAETLPEIVTYDETGRIDALRYDLLGVALLSVVQDQADRIERLETQLRELSR